MPLRTSGPAPGLTAPYPPVLAQGLCSGQPQPSESVGAIGGFCPQCWRTLCGTCCPLALSPASRLSCHWGPSRLPEQVVMSFKSLVTTGQWSWEAAQPATREQNPQVSSWPPAPYSPQTRATATVWGSSVLMGFPAQDELPVAARGDRRSERGNERVNAHPCEGAHAHGGITPHSLSGGPRDTGEGPAPPSTCRFKVAGRQG